MGVQKNRKPIIAPHFTDIHGEDSLGGGGGAELPPTATPAEMADGTETDLRSVSPKLVRDAILDLSDDNAPAATDEEMLIGDEAGVRDMSPAQVKAATQAHGPTLPNQATSPELLGGTETAPRLVSPADIKTAVEAHESATPTLPDTASSADIVTGTETDVKLYSPADLNSAIDSLAATPAQASGAELTAGTETDLRSYSPADVKAAVEAHGGGSFSEHTVQVIHGLKIADGGVSTTVTENLTSGGMTQLILLDASKTMISAPYTRSGALVSYDPGSGFWLNLGHNGSTTPANAYYSLEVDLSVADSTGGRQVEFGVMVGGVADRTSFSQVVRTGTISAKQWYGVRIVWTGTLGVTNGLLSLGACYMSSSGSTTINVGAIHMKLTRLSES